MIGMRTIAGILLGVVVLTTTGCHGQNYVPDYCEAEGRRVPDREKKIRMLVEDYERQGRVIQLASHYRRWMGRNAPDPGNGPQVNEAIEQYLNDHPRFAQIVGRELDESSEWMKGRSNELKTYYEAIEKGYYADLVFMTGDDPDYPRFEGTREFLQREGRRFNFERYSITNCGKFVNWRGGDIG